MRLTLITLPDLPETLLETLPNNTRQVVELFDLAWLAENSHVMRAITPRFQWQKSTSRVYMSPAIPAIPAGRSANQSLASIFQSASFPARCHQSGRHAFFRARATFSQFARSKKREVVA